MEFIFETKYDQKGISVMAEALRKTIRKKRSKRSHIWVILIIVLAVILSIPKNNGKFEITFNLAITWFAVIIMVLTLIFQDKINGYIARKRMIAGIQKSITTFIEESYISETSMGKTEFYYKNILEIAENNDYFIFVFDQSHAQIYDKKGITKGNIDEFRKFITKKTDKQINVMDNEKNKMKNFGKIVFKLIITGVALFISYIVSIYLLLILSSIKINVALIVWSILLLPSLLLITIYSKNKKRDLKRWGIFILLFCLIFGINIGINKYEESITIKTNVNIDCSEYLPFVEETKIVKLDHEASLKLTDNLPRLDGAAAVFPVYSAFVNATYPNTVSLNDGIFEYRNTVRGYRSLALKESDLFFGALPSNEQIDFAKEQGNEFEYTEIAKEAFVFFVHKDNPIESLTTEEIKKIYSGEITNWKEVDGNDEDIIAFQRNEGSGSQSMLIRFMAGTPIMDAPTEQVNDFMVGIIDKVSDYKNKTNSIGFSFRYYMDGIIKNPNVKMLNVDGIEPNVENIKNDNYPITTSLYAVTYKNNDNENVQKLLDWILSSEGQEIIEKTGYVGIK